MLQYITWIIILVNATLRDVTTYRLDNVLELLNETSSDNISIGQHSNYCGKGASNIAIGRKTRFNDDLVGNSFNVAIGDCAMMGAANMGTSTG